jgi:hypothetical protein
MSEWEEGGEEEGGEGDEGAGAGISEPAKGVGSIDAIGMKTRPASAPAKSL